MAATPESAQQSPVRPTLHGRQISGRDVACWAPKHVSHETWKDGSFARFLRRSTVLPRQLSARHYGGHPGDQNHDKHGVCNESTYEAVKQHMSLRA